MPPESAVKRPVRALLPHPARSSAPEVFDPEKQADFLIAFERPFQLRNKVAGIVLITQFTGKANGEDISAFREFFNHGPSIGSRVYYHFSARFVPVFSGKIPGTGRCTVSCR